MEENRKKGFSLVELIVAIAILGMLMSIAVIAASKWLDKAKKDYYDSLNKNLILVGQSYVQDNRNSLPKAIGRSTKITLQTLKDKKYLTSDVVDYSKKSCDLEKSYVKVFKYSENDYSYMAYLVCPNYTSKEETYANGPEIEIDFNNSVNVARAVLTMKDPDKILSYSYIVYKDGLEVKNTGTVSAKLQEEVKTTVSLKKYVPSKVKITVTATDIYGNVSTKSKTEDLKDMIPPICGEVTGSSTTWATGERKITVACTDDGVGCERDSYSKKFKTSMKEGTITIKDKSGNSTNCKVNVYLDNDTPTTPTSQVHYNGSTGALKTDTNWTNQNLWWGNFSSNSVSGIDHYEYSEDCKNKTGNVANGTLYQIDMNKSYCLRAVNKVGAVSPWSSASTFRIDKTAPSVPSSVIRIGSSSGTVRLNTAAWTNQKLWWGSFYAEDSQSGVDHYEYSSGCTGEKSDNLSSSYLYPLNNAANANHTFCICAVDKVGNASAWSSKYYFRIDTEKPSCGNISGASTTWTGNDRTIKVACSDTGGSGCKANPTSKTFTTTTKKGKVTLTDNAGNSTTCKANVYVDKTPPTVKFSPQTNKVCTGPHVYKFRAALEISDAQSGYGHFKAEVKINGVTNKYNYDNNCGANKTCREGFCSDASPKGKYVDIVISDKVGNKTYIKGVGFAKSGTAVGNTITYD